MKVASKWILILLLLPATGNAQFQKKFTLDFGASTLLPIKAELRDNRLPYLFSNFQYGYGGYLSGVYNLSRKFSVGLTGTMSVFQSWKDPRTDGTGDLSFFNIYSLNPNIKYRFFKGKFSPFVMGGAGISVFHGQRAQTKVLIEDFYFLDFENYGSEFAGGAVSIDDVLIREPGYKIDPTGALNFLAGVGIEFAISQTIGITMMACYNTSLTQGYTILDQNLQYFSFPIGINLKLGKSKTI